MSEENEIIEVTKMDLDKDFDMLYLKFAKIFGFEACNDTLMTHLKSIAIPNHPACNKKITSLYKCQDCETNDTSCICIECYENSKEKHKDHRVSFFSDRKDASCDCGEPSQWNPKGACSNHKGPFKSDEEIQAFISSSFTQEQTVLIQSTLKELIFKILLLIALKEINNKKDNIQFIQFIEFINEICEVNQAFIHILSELFLQSSDINTNHNCFIITPTSVEFFKTEEKNHACKCPVIKSILEVYQSSQNDTLLYFLLNSYKLKIVMGLSFLASFNNLIVSQSETVFRFSIQVFFPESNAVMLNSPSLLEEFIGYTYYLFIYAYLKAKSCFLLEELIDNFFDASMNLLKFDSYALINNHLFFHKKLIKMLRLLHNADSMAEVTGEFQFEGYNQHYLMVEWELLDFASYLFSIFDYNNENSVNEIFNYFFGILKVKKVKPIQATQYSFHISLFRVFSIFLTHYLFWYSINNGVELKLALEDFMIKYDFDYEYIIMDLLKVVGFIISIRHNYWMLYGLDMFNYPELYFQTYLMSLCDITLLQLLCSYHKYAHLLSIDNILKATNVYGSYDKLKSLLVQTDSDIEPSSESTEFNLEWTQDKDNTKILLYGKDVIDFMIMLQRDNHSIIDLLLFSYKDLKGKKIYIPDFANFIQLEQGVINPLQKRLIAHIILANKNYCQYSVIQKALSKVTNLETDEEELNTIINEILIKNTSNTSNQPVAFSLKPEYYHLIDISSCISYTQKGLITRYILEFKQKDINLLQTSNILSTTIEKSMKDDYNSALYSPENVKWLCLITIAQLKNNKWEQVFRNYLYSSLKYLAVIVSIYNNNKNTAEGQSMLTESINVLRNYYKQITTCLSTPGVTLDENHQLLCDYLNQLLDQCFSDSAIIQQASSSSIKDSSVSDTKAKTDKKNELLSKYKQQFKEKNKQFVETMGISELSTQLDSQLSIKGCQCIICRIEINKDSYYTNPFGRLGLIIKDAFVHNTRYHNLKLKYKKHNIVSSAFSSFEDFIGTDYQENMQLRLLTCNHYVHFSCYDELTLQNENNHKCPFCQQEINAFIPFIDMNQKDDIIQGLQLETFLKYMQPKKNDGESIEDTPNLNLNTQSYIWQPPVNNFIEQIAFSKIEKKIISDINKEDGALVTIYIRLLDLFRGFFVFYENYPFQQLSLINSFISSIRLSIKGNYMNAQYFYDTFMKIINNLLSPQSIDLTEGKLSELIDELLFLYIILFGNDYESANIIYLLKLFLPYISAEIILKTQLESKCKINLNENKKAFDYDAVIKYIDNNEETKRLFTCYLYKFVLCMHVMSSHNQDIDNLTYNTSNSLVFKDFNNYLSLLGLSSFKDKTLSSLLSIEYPSFWPKSDNSINILKAALNQFTLSQTLTLKPLLFEIGMDYKVTFYDLPSVMLDYTLMLNTTPCGLCKEKDSVAFLCLICGTKICSKTGCAEKTYNELSPYLYHSITCGMGNTVYIDLDFGIVLLVRQGKLIVTYIYLYLNQFGEPVGKKEKILKDYKFSQMEEDKVKHMYITYSQRKSN